MCFLEEEKTMNYRGFRKCTELGPNLIPKDFSSNQLMVEALGSQKLHNSAIVLIYNFVESLHTLKW